MTRREPPLYHPRMFGALRGWACVWVLTAVAGVACCPPCKKAGQKRTPSQVAEPGTGRPAVVPEMTAPAVATHPLDAPLASLFEGGPESTGIAVGNPMPLNHGLPNRFLVRAPKGWKGAESMSSYYSGLMNLYLPNNPEAGVRIEEVGPTMTDASAGATAARVESARQVVWKPAVDGKIGGWNMPMRLCRGRGVYEGKPARFFWGHYKAAHDTGVIVTGKVLDAASTPRVREFLAAWKGIRKG